MEVEEVSLNSIAPVSDVKDKMPQINFQPEPSVFEDIEEILQTDMKVIMV